MRAWPSHTAIVLGGLGVAGGLFLHLTVDYTSAASMRSASLAGTFLLGGAILLAAGLHALQNTFSAWCDRENCATGCGCCGADCTCGDCESGRGSPVATGAEPQQSTL